MKLKLAAIAFALAAATAWAETEEYGGVTYTYTISDGEAIITAASDDAKIVEIPSTLGGVMVTTLRGGVFMNNTLVQKVIIPETVTKLESYNGYIDGTYYSGIAPFYGCIALTSVNIPSGVTALPNNCFYGCSHLRKIVLPDGLKTIGSGVFQSCSALATINFPDGLTSIESAFAYCSSLKTVILPDSVTSLGGWAFYCCYSLGTVHLSEALTSIKSYTFSDCHHLAEINIPSGLTSVEGCAFRLCYDLMEITLPATVKSVGDYAFGNVGRVNFLGRPPAGFPNAGVASVTYPREYGEQWATQVEVSKFGGFIDSKRPVVTIISATARENDPTVFDVVYKVASEKEKVNVRALAFTDGTRSFANVVRPETFVDGTGVGEVTANEEHTLSWNVAADIKSGLVNVAVEIFAVEDDILPLEITKIPANGEHKAMEVSWNALTTAQIFDGLLWCYADKGTDLTLEDGVLKIDGKVLSTGTDVSTRSDSYSSSYDSATRKYTYVYYTPAADYVFGKMGFGVLADDNLTYANSMTRLGLEPSGVRQYAYREVE